MTYWTYHVEDIPCSDDPSTLDNCLAAHLNELGQEGWELAYFQYPTIVLKRSAACNPDVLFRDAVTAVLKRLEQLLDGKTCTPVEVLHAAQYAILYFRLGETVDAACFHACVKHLNFEMENCLWCGTRFLSQRGDSFCTIHCWRQFNNHEANGEQYEACPFECRYCDVNTKRGPHTRETAEQDS